jgi:16S rRNA processing protein RimM
MALIDRERLVCIGTVQEPYGLKGEVKVKPLTATPGFYARTSGVILDQGAGLRAFRVRTIRQSGAVWLFALEGVTDREAARRLQGAEILLEPAQVKPLAPEEFFLDDLIGCEVRDGADALLGHVSGWIETGANDVLEVTTGAGEVLVPMTEEVVKVVDVAGRCIRLEPLPGLFEPAE